jgi:hypothetical protein
MIYYPDKFLQEPRKALKTLLIKVTTEATTQTGMFETGYKNVKKV